MVSETACRLHRGGASRGPLANAVRVWLDGPGDGVGSEGAPGDGGESTVVLFEALCGHAGRLLRRRRLRGVEPSDVAADVLFHGGAPAALRAFALRQRAAYGLDQAVRGIQRAVQNAVWQLHEAQDPEGARAFRAVRLLRRAGASATAWTVSADGRFDLGPATAGSSLGFAVLATLLRRTAAAAPFAGIWQLRCHRALARRLGELLAAVRAQADAAQVRFSCSADELQGFVAKALRAQVHNELLALSVDGDEGQRVIAHGRDALPKASTAAQEWDYEALERRHVEAIVGLLQHELASGRLDGRTLYGARRQRLLAVVEAWRRAGAIVDPLSGLLAGSLRKAAAYDDRALLRSAVQAAGRSLSPEDLSA